MVERVKYLDPQRGIHVEAFTDGYAYDDHLRVYLLSVAGRPSNVKAVTGALLAGRGLDIVSDDIISVGKAYGESYRILSSKLPSGFLHQLAVSELFSDNGDGQARLIYVPDAQDAARAAYEAVRSRCPVPLVPEWSDWLYERMRKLDMLEELHGNRTVLRLNAEEDLLDEVISEGVKTGELGF